MEGRAASKRDNGTFNTTGPALRRERRGSGDWRLRGAPLIVPTETRGRNLRPALAADL